MMRERILKNGYIIKEFFDDSPAPAPAPVAPTYSRLAFMDALGDAVILAIITSTDPVIKMIEKRFDAASLIDSADPRTLAALDYLIAVLPEMTEEIKTSICAPI